MKFDWLLAKTTIYTNKTLKLLLLFISWNFFAKRRQTGDKKENLQQNSVCLEQQIYTSPENYTQALLVMLDTIRGSGLNQTLLVWYAALGSVPVCLRGILPHMVTLKGG